MSEPKVISLKSIVAGAYVRVDRGTDWGNPFVMHKNTEQERHRVCDLFELYAKWRLTVDPKWLLPLQGKDLACWCAPRRCHAETLLRLANE
jgi:hypothetical protein